MAVGGGPLGSAASGELLLPRTRAAALAWADADVDAGDGDRLRALVAAAEAGGPDAAEAAAEVEDAMVGLLEFGTAGLRGALGPGPNRMNRAVVVTAAAGLTAYLLGLTARPFVVIGYDARTGSEQFARDTAGVVVAAGGRAAVLPRVLPTPVLAYAVRALGADAGVMVTASHNPPQDNGYKVYVGDGSQIVAPIDGLIAAEIARVGAARSVPRAASGWATVDEPVIEAYLDAAAAVVAPDSPREVSVVHTAMHGVGTETVLAAFERAGFAAPLVVGAQAEPDPLFPTVAFPNPEEPGAMDLALELAEQTGPDLVIANDPDADRCAAAIAGPGGWRMLRGDEVGAILGWHLLRRGPAQSRGGVMANSIVSSRLLAAMCGAADVAHEETLTGFKWIGRVPGLVYGYEEALGYCVDPAQVKDKDGVTAALLLAEIAASQRAAGRTLTDILDDLAREHGVYATDAFSVRVADLGLIDTVMARLRSSAPPAVAGVDVARIDDLALGDGGLPPTEGLRWFLADRTRIIVRPSGTEPKLKVYLEVIEPVAGDLRASRRIAAERLAAVRADLEALTRIR